MKNKWWILVALVGLSGVTASVVAPQVWLQRHSLDIDPAPDPEFAEELGCTIVQICGTPHQSLTLFAEEAEVRVEPVEGAPPGWLDCAQRQVEPYRGIGSIPINPCK